ncbi:MAG: hypothetical protein JOY82_07395 [Streptosporangiaceae bacterium]|nr:hypothetical protein [Streptosporangiaceae bacterium]
MPGEPGPEPRRDGAACGAEEGCHHAVCFQVQLKASGPEPVLRRTDVCADHLGGMVQELSTWARERGLTGGRLTIFAVDPEESERVKGSGRAQATGRQPAAFPFAEIPLGR